MNSWSGINSVIAAATIEGENSGCDVIGIYEGFKRLREGKSKTVAFTAKDVLKIQTQGTYGQAESSRSSVCSPFDADGTGGSILRTSKMHPRTPQEVDNCLRVLEHLRVRYLVVGCCFYHSPLHPSILHLVLVAGVVPRPLVV